MTAPRSGPPWIGGDHDTTRPGYDTDHHAPTGVEEMTEAAELRVRLQYVEHDLQHVARERDDLAAKVAAVRAVLDEQPNIQPLWNFERGALRGIEMTKAAVARALGIA